MKRKAPGLFFARAMVLSVVVGYAGHPAMRAAAVPSPDARETAGAADPLAFPKDAFTEDTTTVRTSQVDCHNRRQRGRRALGASGNSRLYDAYLKEIGAADADDAVFASAAFCPNADLEHADMAYEWMVGAVPARSGLVDQALSRQLRDAFAAYQASLKLRGTSGFGTLTADNYAKYLLQTYLFPAANRYLRGLTEAQRKEYLASNTWMTWADNGATFPFADFITHVGRMKSLPAFDDFDMRQPEPNEFGNKTTNSRHFTNFSLRHATGNPNATIDSDVQTLVNLMNPMYFIGQNNKGLAGHWWIRLGTSDNHTSLTVAGNLAASLENRKQDVNALMYWDAGHGADQDAEDFIAWIGQVTGFTGRK